MGLPFEEIKLSRFCVMRPENGIGIRAYSDVQERVIVGERRHVGGIVDASESMNGKKCDL